MAENKTLTILKIQLLNLYGINKIRHSHDPAEKAKARRQLLLIAFAFIVMLVYIVMFIFSFISAGLVDSVIPLMAGITCAFTLLTSFLGSGKAIFLQNDNETLMSMPVKTSEIVLSRLLYLYILNEFFVLYIMIPTVVIYAMNTATNAVFWIMFTVTLPFLALLPIAVASIIGVALTAATSKFKFKNALTTVLSLLIFLGIFALSFSMGNVSDDAFSSMLAGLKGKIAALYPMLDIYEKLLHGDVLSLLLFLAISAVSCAVFTLLTMALFKKVTTLLSTKTASSHYKLKKAKAGSPLTALYKKELKRYFSTSIYVVNTIISPIFVFLLGGLFLFKSPSGIAAEMEIPGLDALLPSIAALILTLPLLMGSTTASSVSLEGKNLWVVRSLPVSLKTVYQSKIAVNLTILLPASVIGAVLFTISFRPDIPQFIGLLLFPAAFCFLVSCTGLWLNLKMPKYDWETEVEPVKQGFPVMLSMLICFLVFAISAVLFFVLSLFTPVPAPLNVLIVTILPAGFAYLFYRLSLRTDM